MVEAGSLLCEWRVLDAQYFGVPQRRRRVFVVAVFDSATANRCPDPLLPISEGLRWHPTTRTETREDTTDTASASVRSSRAIIGSDIVGPLAASDWKFPQQQQVHENKCVVETFTKSRRAQSATDDETWVEGKPAPTLNSFDQGDVRATTAIVFENSYRDGARIANDHVTQTLSAKMGTGGGNTPMLMFDTQFGSNANVFENQSPTLKASQAAPSVAYSIREDAKAGNFSATELNHANSLSALQPSTQSHHAQMFIAESTMAVRRLTPLECERLMGWPDDHTRYKADGTEQADTHRYKQCGNGVASPVAEWIGEQLRNL